MCAGRALDSMIDKRSLLEISYEERGPGAWRKDISREQICLKKSKFLCRDRTIILLGEGKREQGYISWPGIQTLFETCFLMEIHLIF